MSLIRKHGAVLQAWACLALVTEKRNWKLKIQMKRFQGKGRVLAYEFCLSVRLSVRLSVCHDPVPIQGQVRYRLRVFPI